MAASDGSAVNWRMFGTQAALFPLGLAMTLSTVPISLTILVLLSPQRSRIAVPYLVGWVFGIAFFATVLTVGLLAASRSGICRVRAARSYAGDQTSASRVLGAGTLIERSGWRAIYATTSC